MYYMTMYYMTLNRHLPKDNKLLTLCDINYHPKKIEGLGLI
jgi:hypothetical protein